MASNIPKLSRQDVFYIDALSAAGWTQMQIAAKFCVTQGVISRALRRAGGYADVPPYTPANPKAHAVYIAALSRHNPKHKQESEAA